MFAALPSDVSREIALLAIRQRNTDVCNEIRATIAHVLDYATEDLGEYEPIPLFPGSSTRVSIEVVSRTKIGIMTTVSVEFWIEDQEFFLTKTTYKEDGFEEDDEYSLFVHNKDGKYSDIVAETFKNLLPRSIVY